ncbi:hypothetical protein H310_08516 [Aphanomyces invadans]|uniref:Uncharacterized protein n=1 Tax=Aphanomyces invadans TaxID=157072 RepID=A0A024TYM0_9STRA|nr:hypothetical protein H310_08516 [Aphanomyces invadans]ETV99094.1 hypothetical protein H310_08516 [Aphanomyces invadans]|eukprot:XP_008872522.1 hypothetical protein H310_08516 [Aphanomyces invadans]
MAPRLSFLLFAVATADAIVPCASNMQVSVRFTNDIYCVYTPPCSGLHLPEKTGCPTKGAVAIHSTNILQTDTCCAIIDSKNAVGCVIPVPGSTQCIVGPTTVPSAPATTTYDHHACHCSKQYKQLYFPSRKHPILPVDRDCFQHLHIETHECVGFQRSVKPLHHRASV